MKKTDKTPWRLILLGDGPQRDLLENFVRSYGLIEDVIFPGFRQVGEIPYYYALARVFIHPALQDQWGLVVNEAMAGGLPALVSDRAGCARELVIPGITGWLFDPEDLKTLTSLLIVASTDKEYLLGEMGRAAYHHVENWSPKRFAESLHQAYLQIDGKR